MLLAKNSQGATPLQVAGGAKVCTVCVVGLGQYYVSVFGSLVQSMRCLSLSLSPKESLPTLPRSSCGTESGSSTLNDPGYVVCSMSKRERESFQNVQRMLEKAKEVISLLSEPTMQAKVSHHTHTHTHTHSLSLSLSLSLSHYVCCLSVSLKALVSHGGRQLRQRDKLDF